MKALIKNEDAQAGIGTLIIFIAMVLVAAVAAAVLISTSGTLQQKAQKTGTETIADVSTNLKVLSLVGYRINNTDTSFTQINATIEVAPGAGNIDLSQLRISITNGTAMINNMGYGTTLSATNFTVTALRDPGGTFSSASPVISSGSLVAVTIDTPNATIAFPVRSAYSVSLIPEVGTPIVISGNTPSTYGTANYVTIG